MDKEEIKRKQQDEITKSPINNINHLLTYYSLKNNSAEIDYNEFLNFIQKTLSQDPANKILQRYTSDTESLIKSDIELLSIENRCVLRFMDGAVKTIIFPGYYLNKIQKAYEKMENDMEASFPSEESLKIKLPDQFIKTIDVKINFLNLLNRNDFNTIEIIKLQFPEIQAIIITSDLVREKLLDFAVLKAKLYLDKKSNASYIENKVYPVFPQNTVAVRELINNIIVRPTQAINTFKEPSDFTFRFWAHFANLIIQEFKQKNELLPKEIDYYQSAYLIGFYNMYYKGTQQKEKDRNIALKHFEKQIKGAPFAFTITEIYGFKDSNGQSILTKLSKDVINKTIELKLKSNDKEKLPELIRIITATGKDFYIHKESVIPLFLRQVYDASQDLRKSYLNRWIGLLKNQKKTDVMLNEEKFTADLTEKLQISYPLLSGLLNYGLLFLANIENKDKRTNAQVSFFFDKVRKQLQPLNVILNINRSDLYEEAKTYLPFWETIPIIKWFAILAKKIFGRNKIETKSEEEKISRRLNTRYAPISSPAVDNSEIDEMDPIDDDRHAAPESGSKKESSHTQKSLIPKLRIQYKKALETLKDHYVGKNDSIDSKLAFLADKWNPLFDVVAKKNLVTDVNSSIQDFMRSLRKGFRVKPPDIKRIENISDSFSKNKSFDEIKKKDYFKQYIQVYMIKVLGENKF